jgi:hypothetical protein
MYLYFTGKDDVPSIENFIKEEKLAYKEKWRGLVSLHLQGDASIWWASLKYSQIMTLSDEEFEKMEAIKEVIAKSEVESEEKSTEGDEAKLQEGLNQEAKEVIDADQDHGGKTPAGHHVHLPLGWMDGHTWY